MSSSATFTQFWSTSRDGESRNPSLPWAACFNCCTSQKIQLWTKNTEFPTAPPCSLSISFEVGNLSLKFGFKISCLSLHPNFAKLNTGDKINPRHSGKHSRFFRERGKQHCSVHKYHEFSTGNIMTSSSNLHNLHKNKITGEYSVPACKTFSSFPSMNETLLLLLRGFYPISGISGHCHNQI